MHLPLGTRLGLAALLGLAGCQSREAPPERPLPDNPYVDAAEHDLGLALDGDGFYLIAWGTGASEAVRFGAPMPTALDAIAQVRGGGAVGEHVDCTPGLSLAWEDGLALWFAEDVFVGWTVDGRQPEADRIATLDGFGIGSTRAELAMLVDVDGASFDISGVSGRLDGDGPTARVTALRAGEGCGGGA